MPQHLQLRVVFDTNTIHIDSGSDLVRPEIENLVTNTVHRDLHVLWYLPDVVRHERQYQMGKKALEIHSSLKRIERFLGQGFNVPKEMFLERVKQAVDKGRHGLNFLPLALDTTTVNWQRLMSDACHRQPPFQEGQSEKGFR
jgi:hypothetical protein